MRIEQGRHAHKKEHSKRMGLMCITQKNTHKPRDTQKKGAQRHAPGATQTQPKIRLGLVLSFVRSRHARKATQAQPKIRLGLVESSQVALNLISEVGIGAALGIERVPAGSSARGEPRALL